MNKFLVDIINGGRGEEDSAPAFNKQYDSSYTRIKLTHSLSNNKKHQIIYKVILKVQNSNIIAIISI